MFGANTGNELTAVVLCPAQDVAATANQTGIDLQAYTGQGVFILNCGAATAGTSPTMDVTLEDSDDNSTYHAISAGVFSTVTDAADSLQQIVLDTDSLRRYVRAVTTIGGTDTPSFPVAVEFVGSKRIPA